jgi:hypothetical protein
MIPQLSRRTACVAVLALTVFALGLRLAGIGFNLPHGTLGDESVYASFFLRAAGDPHLDPAEPVYYPQLIPRLALFLRHDSDVALHSLADHLARASADVILLRCVGACLSVLLVPATYLLARHFLDRTAAVLAAALASASFLGLWFSEQARPHGAFAALCTLTLLGALDVRRRGDLRAWICAGIACALAIGTLQTGILLLCPLVVAHFLHRPRRTLRAQLLPLVAVPFLALAVRAFYPTSFEPRDVAHGSAVVQPSIVTWVIQNITGKGFGRSLRALWEYEPWLSLCAVIGIGAVGWRLISRRASRSMSLAGAISSQRIGDLAVIAAFFVPLAILIGLYEYAHERYLLPFVPIFACCAAGGLEIACERIAEPRGRSAARWFLPAAAGMFALQAVFALALARVRAADDTAREAAAWIATHVERGAERIAMRPGLELPLLRDDSSSAWLASFAGYTHNAWLAYQSHLDRSVRSSLGWPIQVLPASDREDVARILADPDRYVDELPAELVVIALPDRGALHPRIHDALRRRGELVARFTPWRFPKDDERPFLRNEWDDPTVVSGSWIWNVLRARCLGPVIEIYRIHGRER